MLRLDVPCDSGARAAAGEHARPAAALYRAQAAAPPSLVTRSDCPLGLPSGTALWNCPLGLPSGTGAFRWTCRPPPGPTALTGNQVAHRLLRGHQHLAAQVPALLLRGQLVLKVHCSTGTGPGERGAQRVGDMGGGAGRAVGMRCCTRQPTRQRAGCCALSALCAQSVKPQRCFPHRLRAGAHRQRRRTQSGAWSARTRSGARQSRPLQVAEGGAGGCVAGAGHGSGGWQARCALRSTTAAFGSGRQATRASCALRRGLGQKSAPCHVLLRGSGTRRGACWAARAPTGGSQLQLLACGGSRCVPGSTLTGIRHDGQEVVASHLALGVLDLVGALQGLQGATGGRHGEGGGGQSADAAVPLHRVGWRRGRVARKRPRPRHCPTARSPALTLLMRLTSTGTELTG